MVFKNHFFSPPFYLPQIHQEFVKRAPRREPSGLSRVATFPRLALPTSLPGPPGTLRLTELRTPARCSTARTSSADSQPRAAKVAAPPMLTAMNAKKKTTTSAMKATNSMKVMPKKIKSDASHGCQKDLKKGEREYWHWEDTRDITDTRTRIVYKGDLPRVQSYKLERNR